MTVKELRTKAGMTQAEFAEYFGITLDTIKNWEQGRSKCQEPMLNLLEYKLKKEKLI